MTEPTDEEVRAIAKKLTKAQQAFVADVAENQGETFRGIHSPFVIAACHAKGLIFGFYPDFETIHEGHFWLRDPLGARVAAVLREGVR